jgi:hypothetical protein
MSSFAIAHLNDCALVSGGDSTSTDPLVCTCGCDDFLAYIQGLEDHRAALIRAMESVLKAKSIFDARMVAHSILSVSA